MTQLLDQITAGWKDAMKGGEPLRRDVLSGLRAAIRNGEINARVTGTFDDAAAQAVVDKEAKKRREAIEEYTKVGRADLADKEAAELAIIKEFLPAQLSDDELLVLVREAVAQAGATAPKDMGKVMGLVIPQIAGKADGKVASALVKELLSGN